MDNENIGVIGFSDLFEDSEIDKDKIDKANEEMFKDTQYEKQTKTKLNDEIYNIINEIDEGIGEPEDSHSGNNYNRDNDFSMDEDFSFNDPEMRSKTMDEKKTQLVNNVFGSMGVENEPDDGHTFEKERESDDKMNMVTEISLLRDDLSRLDIPLENVPEVSTHSSKDEIQQVLNILRHKLNRSQYSSLAEEFVIAGVTVLEELFDGKKTYFNRFSPDLTGYNNEVRVRLYRSRNETSKFVADTIESYNIPPLVRIALELVPSAILYSRNRKMSSNSDDDKNHNVMNEARNRMREL